MLPNIICVTYYIYLFFLKGQYNIIESISNDEYVNIHKKHLQQLIAFSGNLLILTAL